MSCIKCGAQLPEGALYCPMCGKKQIVEKRARRQRGNGQGTAVKRGKTWTAIWTEGLYLVPGTQKLCQKRRWKGGFPTKTAALAYAADPPEQRAVKSATLRDYWAGWEQSGYQELSKSKQTAQKIAWGKLSDLAGRDMLSLTITDLQDCIDQHAKTFYPAKDMKTVLSHLFKRAVAEGNARTNLADFISLPPLEEKEAAPFTEEELHKFWEAYGNGDRIIGFVLLMTYTGMMPGELFRLKASMIDWSRLEIIGAGAKTKKRKQTPIVFPAMLTPVLENLVSTSPSTSGYVLGMNRDKFYAQYHAAVVSAGVRDLPPYSCRHTTATALALGNIAPSVIQQVMRHTKFSTTQRYIHPDRSSAHSAVEQLNKGKADIEA